MPRDKRALHAANEAFHDQREPRPYLPWVLALVAIFWALAMMNVGR